MEIVKAKELVITYEDNSVCRVKLDSTKVVERETIAGQSTYTVFSTKGGPCFAYTVGMNHIESIAEIG